MTDDVCGDTAALMDELTALDGVEDVEGNLRAGWCVVHFVDDVRAALRVRELAADYSHTMTSMDGTAGRVRTNWPADRAATLTYDPDGTEADWRGEE